jgi:hypothetical protein
MMATIAKGLKSSEIILVIPNNHEIYFAIFLFLPMAFPHNLSAIELVISQTMARFVSIFQPSTLETTFFLVHSSAYDVFQERERIFS